MSETVYMIRQEAVYNHKILGVFSTRERAVEVFNALYAKTTPSWMNEFDGHHIYKLYKLTLDEAFVRTEDKYLNWSGNHPVKELSEGEILHYEPLKTPKSFNVNSMIKDEYR